MARAIVITAQIHRVATFGQPNRAIGVDDDAIVECRDNAPVERKRARSVGGIGYIIVWLGTGLVTDIRRLYFHHLTCRNRYGQGLVGLGLTRSQWGVDGIINHPIELQIALGKGHACQQGKHQYQTKVLHGTMLNSIAEMEPLMVGGELEL